MNQSCPYAFLLVSLKPVELIFQPVDHAVVYPRNDMPHDLLVFGNSLPGFIDQLPVCLTQRSVVSGES